MTIKLGAENATEAKVRELAAWGVIHSPVSCTLRGRSPVTVDVSVI